MSVPTIFLLGITLSGYSQDKTDMDSRTREVAQTLVNAHKAWSKLSGPGVSIEAKEAERQGPAVKYELFVSGLPSEALYTVVSWPVTQQKPSSLIEGASLGKNGIVVCAGRTQEQCGDPSKKDDPIDFVFVPAKGEPIRLALISGENKAAIVFVPDPISGKDKGCTLNAERLLPHFELAFFTGSGFPPNTEVTFDSQSYDEKHELKAKTDADGNLQFALLPGVAGKTKGTTTVKGIGMKCSPTLKFDWGK